MKAKISKVVLNLGSREIELSLEEARELFNSLEEFFGKKVEHHPIWIRPNRWDWDYPRPYWRSATGTKFEMKDSTLTCSLAGNADTR